MDRIEIHENRIRMGLSQATLSRRANGSRFKLPTFEAGGGSLNNKEPEHIREDMIAEATLIKDCRFLNEAEP
jgi:hypothetical protein